MNIHQQRNTTPINILPNEILLHIFFTLVTWDATCHDHRDDKQRLWEDEQRRCKGRETHTMIISWVNTSWRRLVVNTSSFWSHIDICFGSGYWLPLDSFSLECLARVKEAPLELHIKCGHPGRVDITSTTLPDFLRDRKVTSLIITTRNPTIIQPTIGIYLNESTRSNLTRLRVELTSHWTRPKFCFPVPAQTNQEQLIENLLRLDTLRLSDVTIGWPGARFSELVDLQLHIISPDLSIDQIYDTLAASPQLHTLQLKSFRSTSHDFTGVRSNTRVKLPKLSFLGLHGNYKFAARLLETIEPGVGPLCLRLWIPIGPSEGLAPLRIWPDITSLSLIMPHNFLTPLHQVLPSLKALTNLAIDSQYISDPYVVPDTIGSQNPCLRRIKLERCEITPATLRHIASIRSVHSLWLEQCTYTSQHQHESLEYLEYELSWLEETIPDVYVDRIHYRKARRSLPWWLQQ